MNKIKSNFFVLAAAVIVFVAVAFIASSSKAQQVISYQGEALNNGVPVQGLHTMALAIYSSASGSAAVWSESESVIITDGIFNILLGVNKANPLPIFDAGDYTGTARPAPDYFLGITIDAGTELPRTKLGASPTAFSSRFADSARTSATATTALNLAPSAGGVVTTINTLSGALTLAGSGGTTITKSGQTITIGSSGGGGTGIQGIQNIDGTIDVTNPNGPTATIGLADGAVSTAKIAAGAVTTAKIANGAVTNTLVGSGSATNGQVLAANGSGGATWVSPSTFSLPYSQTVSSNSTLFSITNSGAGSSIEGAASAASASGVQGTTSNATGIGVLGFASDAGPVGILSNSGVCGSSAAGNGTSGITNSGYGVVGAAYTSGVGVYGAAGSGAPTARAGLFEISNPASTANAVEINNPGMGGAIKAVSTSITSTNPAILAQTSSNANVAAIKGESASVTPTAITVGVLGVNDATNGSGVGVEGHCLSNGVGVYGRTESAGVGIEGVTLGAGDAVYGEGDGVGNGVEGYGFQGGTGVVARAASTGTACNAFIANMEGSTVSTLTANNCAIFESAGVHVARIDRTGKGYFDGGTVNSGADVAEEFAVAGSRAGYEPGDVLVISTKGDREVEKSSEPYSRLVAGVYATKPGVTLTYMNIDADRSANVPLGVIGVIPTKVSSENGPIAIGDILVTSSTPGCAMKADLSKLQIGQAIGKALQNFSGKGSGVIEVLVGKY